MNRFFTALFGIIFVLLSACQQQNKNNTLRIGTIAGPETELMEVARDYAQKKHGLTLEIIEFSDYNIPNAALNDHSIDANMFQHLPYLNETVKERHFKLVPIGKTFIYPMAVYSEKWRKLSQVPDNAVIAIPNDPSNEARALLLLEKAGLIRLKPGVATHATVQDIISTHPAHLNIKEIDAAQLTRLLPDVDLAVINTNYAIPAGLIPSVNALFTEKSDSLYANIIAVRAEDKNNPQIKTLLEALHSKEVIQKAEKLFRGEAIPAWKK